MLYTLNLHSTQFQLYLNKTRRESLGPVNFIYMYFNTILKIWGKGIY